MTNFAKLTDSTYFARFSHPLACPKFLRPKPLGVSGISALLLAGLLGLTSCQEQPIEGLRRFHYLGGDQRSGSINYPETPPAGGPYNAFWQACQEYDSPIYNEYAVHSLARGAIWVTYNPKVSPEQLDAVRETFAEAMLVAEGDTEALWPTTRPLLLSPVDNLPTPLMISIWNYQLPLNDVADSRLKRFLQKYKTAPVPLQGAGCLGGFEGTR